MHYLEKQISTPDTNVDKRAERPSSRNSPEELSSKAKPLSGENYNQCSTADKLEMIRLFERPLEEQHASGSGQGVPGEICKRYTEIGGAGDAFRKQEAGKQHVEIVPAF